ncbi:MAG: fibronectin type III-like domain-contianing protein, partial [Chloroflexota bacterium]
AAGEPVRVTVEVENVGERAGDEVVQLYVRALDVPPSATPAPRHSLRGFQRIHLAPGAAQSVSFTLDARQLSVVDAGGVRWMIPGELEVFAGGGQPGFAAVVSTTVTVTGEPVECVHLYGPE